MDPVLVASWPELSEAKCGARPQHTFVMPGLVPGIHVFLWLVR